MCIDSIESVFDADNKIKRLVFDPHVCDLSIQTQAAQIQTKTNRLGLQIANMGMTSTLTTPQNASVHRNTKLPSAPLKVP